MEWKNRKIVMIVTAVALLTGVGVSIWLYQLLQPKEDQFAKVIRLHSEREELVQAVKKLQDVWRNGRYSPVSSEKCLNTIPEHRRSCNPDLLSCYLEQWSTQEGDRLRPVTHQGEMVNAISRMKQGEGHLLPFAYKVLLERANQPERRYQVLLEDICNQVYLPGRVYQYQHREKVWRWDNLGQEIYIDKYQVSQVDIDFWDRVTKSISKRSWSGRGRYLPASGLQLSEMERYCHFKGGELLAAHLFDAATYHPGDITKINPYQVGTSLYPWTRKGKKSFLYKIQNGENDSKFKRSYCLFIYSKECRERDVPYLQFVSNATSWSGIYEVMGGVPEAMRNVLNPKQNIFLSSFYFPLTSSWHRLGTRGNWNGRGFDLNDFNWSLPDSDKREEVISSTSPVKVGFRCVRNYYREIY
jgi:hypothetical protein